MRCLTAAASTYRLQRTTMRGTSRHALDLMQDAMVAARHAKPTVAEHLAVASPLSSLEQCRSQRFCRQAQNVVQLNNVDFAWLRREAVVGIDVRPY